MTSKRKMLFSVMSAGLVLLLAGAVFAGELPDQPGSAESDPGGTTAVAWVSRGIQLTAGGKRSCPTGTSNPTRF